ncbi:hypothetical protein [Mucilaginibacter flavidus]|nr:hypothetical protein [Mucilaginibacter flavidus]
MFTFSNNPPAFSTSQKSSVVGDNTNNGVRGHMQYAPTAGVFTALPY